MAIKNASRVGSLYVCGIEMSYEVIWKYLYRITVEDLELMCCEVYTNFESLLFDIVPRVNSKFSSDRPDWLVEGVGFVA